MKKRNTQHTTDSDVDTPKGSLAGCWIVLIFIAICIVGFFSSCTKKVYVPVETVKENTVFRTDTLREVQLRYDSIYVRDSIALVQRNDTVFLTKYRDQYKYLFHTDTVYSAHTDSIYVYLKEPQPYEVEVVKYVDKPLKWWQKTLIWLGVAFFALLAFVVYRAIRSRIK